MLARAPRRRPRRTVGIALGSGGARGLAHLGVLERLSHAGIPIDAVVGTSIGSVVGAVYAAGQLENFTRQVRALEWHDVLRMFDPVWPRSGLMSGDRAVDWLTGLVGDWRIEELAIPFGAVSVDLVSGEEILIREGRVIDAIRASMSIPGVFVPYRSGKSLLVDGALRNPVPVSALEAFGVDIRLAVNLHSQPVREIIEDADDSRSVRPPIAARVIDASEGRLARFRKRGDSERDPADAGPSPNLFEILTASMTVMEDELTRHRLAAEKVDLVLEPDVHSIRAFEFHRAAEAIEAGAVEAQARLAEVEAVVQRRRRLPYWSRSGVSTS